MTTNIKDEALKLALEALESDPLDMVLNPDGHKVFRKDNAIAAIREALAEQPAQQQEPVAICEYCEKERPVIQAEGKPWVGLTDEETKACFDSVPTQDCQSYEHWRSLVAKAIEDKLCQKNT